MWGRQTTSATSGFLTGSSILLSALSGAEGMICSEWNDLKWVWKEESSSVFVASVRPACCWTSRFSCVLIFSFLLSPLVFYVGGNQNPHSLLPTNKPYKYPHAEEVIWLHWPAQSKAALDQMTALCSSSRVPQCRLSNNAIKKQTDKKKRGTFHATTFLVENTV